MREGSLTVWLGEQYITDEFQNQYFRACDLKNYSPEAFQVE